MKSDKICYRLGTKVNQRLEIVHISTEYRVEEKWKYPSLLGGFGLSKE
jgi:hypothetical protein